MPLLTYPGFGIVGSGGGGFTDVEKTASFQLTSSDVSTNMQCSSSNLTVVFIDTNANSSISTGSEFTFEATGSGAVVINPATGVTVTEDVYEISAGESMTLTKTATDTWSLTGDAGALADSLSNTIRSMSTPGIGNGLSMTKANYGTPNTKIFGTDFHKIV